MRWNRLPVGLAAVALMLSGCGGDATNEGNADSGNGADAAADQTIADSLEQDSRFFQAARAAGIDATLAGPGPYTVLVPGDQAFAALPQGSMDEMMQPQQRARLTDVLTYHILPGTVLVEDIERAISNSNGSAVMATMGGQTLNAAREDNRIVLTDASGGQATITEGDRRRSNGVIHHIDGVLMPDQLTGDEEEEADQAEQ